VGDLLKDIPNKKASQGAGTCFLPQGITKNQSSQFQALAKHTDIVEKVKAEAPGERLKNGG
jgi:hypothetical protein